MILTAIAFGAGIISGRAASVAFEAESGALGADWAVSNSSSPAYISITSNSTGSNPGSTNRVATYEVTFPSAGTYQLYARVLVGPNTFNDDSLFYANGLGPKSPTNNSDWITVNGLGSAGFSNSTDVVTGGGSLGSGMWKWINLSQFTSQTGFTVNSGNLTQKFQIGAREDGLSMDKFVFGTADYTFTVADLNAGGPGTPPSAPPPPTFPLAITNASGTSLAAGSNGVYTVSFVSPAWSFTGYSTNGFANRVTSSGLDAIGSYSEITFNYTNAVGHAAGVRLYNNLPVVLFSDTALASTINDLAFPHLAAYPANLNHISFGNTFSLYNFNTLFGDSPWLFFETNADAFIISAATNFMVASCTMIGDGSISCGVNSGITTLPAGFTHRAILVATNGINQACAVWGAALMALGGKTPPANDAATELNELGYWTDNGATYYYNTNAPLGIEATLFALRDEFTNKGVPLGYVQLDSWFYPKGSSQSWNNGNGGIYLYIAHPTLFPDGLGSFRQQLGLPLITHARWIDSSSPYRTNYVMSGNVIVDPSYWTNRMAYLKSSGVITYEQDWLGVNGIPTMNLNDPPAYLNYMQAAAAANGINLQYCMLQPRDFLQGSLYPNLMTVRTSQDDFTTNRWTEFLYGSRLANALGEWPWCDVFMSGEARNLLVSTLSAGPVGVGDALGSVNATNLLKAVRADGVIVKPDVSLVPVDDAYVNDALGLKRPMVATTYTDHNNLRALFVFAYGETPTNLAASFRPAAFGVSDNAFVYDYFAATGTVVSNGGAFNFATTMPDNVSGGSYFIAVPIGASGIALIGDTNKFVTLGQKRISSLSDTGVLRATVVFAPGETNVTLCGYAPTNPFVFALAGSTNNVTYSPATHLFSLGASPDGSGTATVGFSLAPVPSLRITPISLEQFQISWPTNAVGYALEMTTHLSPPVTWTSVTNEVVAVGGQNTVTMSGAESGAFYRLKQ